MTLKPKNKVGRNDPCPCESGLKAKHCHSDPSKIAICERVVQETMLGLIRQEQRKQIIKLQQAECDKCGSTGYDPDVDEKALYPEVDRKLCLDCQFISEEERSGEIYRRKTQNESET